ncbi:NAD(P)/FAD-dependent oxidoreductase [Nitrosovibrio sp. Nv17]|uniref:NAD(P)/FAD-dependent oxidoreductase n=1 Tax=Nitrosovibrio sp. Nv17 TaxID=1855339 RepID=UPI000908C8E3|nr:FAD-dependent oxidoreductase [Nitrosovibrio sp. Nv17]SFW27563.1 rubredoxin-NAD+ reductase [Nitrosovibrio sp. Nv17]
MNPHPIVIIGSGLAGYTAARELRRLDTGIPMQMISADHAGFYSKPMLSNALASGRTPQVILNADAEKMAGQLKMDIRPHTRVVALQPDAHRIVLQSGDTLRYGRLVLALGADPIRLPLEGDGADAILSVNDLDDYRRLHNALQGKREVAILGAGLIGCEFANDLAAAGYRVHLIDLAAQPLGRLLPPLGGAYLRNRLEAIGITFHLETTVRRMERAAECLLLTLDNGTAIHADVVLSAIGLRPRTALARTAGIEVNRGIVVDRFLRTRYPDVYALGDCAEVEGRVLPFVMPIMHAARGLAATLAHTPTPVRYPAMPVVVKTPACAAVVSPADAHIPGEWSVEEGGDGVKALFRDLEDRLLGYALLGAATGEKNQLSAQLPPVMA